MPLRCRSSSGSGQHPSASHRHPGRNAHQSLSFGLKHKATEDGHVCAPKCRQVSRCPKEEAGPKDVLVPSCLCPHPLSSSGLGHASPHSYSPPTEIFLSLKSHFKSPLQATPFLPTSKSLHPCSRPPPPCPLQSPHFRSLLPDHVEVPLQATRFLSSMISLITPAGPHWAIANARRGPSGEIHAREGSRFQPISQMGTLRLPARVLGFAAGPRLWVAQFGSPGRHLLL